MTYEDNERLEASCDFFCRELQDDPAAVRSIRRKLDELQEQLVRGEITVDRAISELTDEYRDCLPA